MIFNEIARTKKSKSTSERRNQVADDQAPNGKPRAAQSGVHLRQQAPSPRRAGYFRPALGASHKKIKIFDRFLGGGSPNTKGG